MDQKLTTFLTLCRTLNYRVAAEELHLTQPAVTKQIQALEQIYNGKLFHYDGRRLHKTEKGLLLESYAMSFQYNYEQLQVAMNKKPKTALRIGATKTIGDYVLCPYIISYLSRSDHSISLLVDNTRELLSKLENNELDFAVIEGIFQKDKYDYHLLRMEPFIGICPADHPLNGQTVSVEDILNETLIVRELGSGTRDILEYKLAMAGFQLSSFSKTTCISSLKLIGELVSSGLGISFLYQSVIGNSNNFGTFQVESITGDHEFNIVYLKNTSARSYADAFFENHPMTNRKI
ncbi:LysR family transcriptional regulator [Alloiococcus sp. CFN-8]|uniref:LysR family transcriptional regulator n=1 Tax=Alloiococcus sp. CFN-8 TaxID=3416081 RepID=UPI003CE79FD5